MFGESATGIALINQEARSADHRRGVGTDLAIRAKQGARYAHADLEGGHNPDIQGASAYIILAIDNIFSLAFERENKWGPGSNRLEKAA